MAIINDLPGVEVTIVTGDTAYQEHIDEDTEEPRTITRYIEVKSEQNFHVAIKVEKGTTFLGDALQFRIMVDGVVVVKALVKKSKCRRRDYHTTRNGQSLPGSQVRPFKFNSMETGTFPSPLCTACTDDTSTRRSHAQERGLEHPEPG